MFRLELLVELLLHVQQNGLQKASARHRKDNVAVASERYGMEPKRERTRSTRATRNLAACGMRHAACGMQQQNAARRTVF